MPEESKPVPPSTWLPGPGGRNDPPQPRQRPARRGRGRWWTWPLGIFAALVVIGALLPEKEKANEKAPAAVAPTTSSAITAAIPPSEPAREEEPARAAVDESPAAEPEAAAREAADYDEPSRNLAVIDGEGDTDLRAVQQRSGALDVLERKCPEAKSRAMLSDYAAKAKQLIEADSGPKVSTLEVMRGLNKAISPGAIGDQTCTDLLAVYVGLVRSGVDP